MNCELFAFNLCYMLFILQKLLMNQCFVKQPPIDTKRHSCCVKAEKPNRAVRYRAIPSRIKFIFNFHCRADCCVCAHVSLSLLLPLKSPKFFLMFEATKQLNQNGDSLRKVMNCLWSVRLA